MNAQTLSIVVGTGCNAACKFCISKCTYNPENERGSLLKIYGALERTLKYAVLHGVDTLILTSKGEPLLYMDDIKSFATRARDAGIPLIEIQTNGKVLSDMSVGERNRCLMDLRDSGVTGISISVAGETLAKNSDVQQTTCTDFWEVGKAIMDHGLLFRLSAVVNSEGFPDEGSIMRFLDKAVDAGVHQVTLRKMGFPHIDNGGSQVKTISEWIAAHSGLKDLAAVTDRIVDSEVLLRKLPWGASVYDYRGMSLCFNDCLPQSGCEDDTWRSIILQTDGHVYHSWEYRGSILF